MTVVTISPQIRRLAPRVNCLDNSMLAHNAQYSFRNSGGPLETINPAVVTRFLDRRDLEETSSLNGSS
jgi:hypothetical protein